MQNTSHAVMSQRREPHDSLDFFPTPPWATRALCEQIGPALGHQSVLEPACGAGDMVRPLTEYFADVFASDIHGYNFACVRDFLSPTDTRRADWIITNPPFRLGQQFATTALRRARRGVALLVRTAFLESADRYETLFRDTPPTDILQFVERVPMLKGRVDRHGSTATAYCWVVWLGRLSGPGPTHFRWIPPCRKRLERTGDYD